MDLILIFAIPIFMAIGLILILARAGSRPRTQRADPVKTYNSGLHGIKGRAPIRGNLKGMYSLLTETLADHIILSKVAFTSLMSTDNKETQATLDTKTADFVVCSREFKVVAVVFLDDGRHGKGSGARNARIDAIMRRAGHRVLRYTEIPRRATLAVDIKRPPVRRVASKRRELPAVVVDRQAAYGERRRAADRRSGITYFDDNFIERRENSDRRQRHANVTHMGGFIERQRSA